MNKINNNQNKIAAETFNTNNNSSKITITEYISLKDIITLSDSTTLTANDILNSKKIDMDPDHEVWKGIPSLNNEYEASSLGRIRKASTKFIYALNANVKNNYPFVRLMFEGEKGYSYVHRLVAEAFYGIPSDSRNQVDHVNGNRWDNRLSNLEWVTPKENINRMFERTKRKEALLN